MDAQEGSGDSKNSENQHVVDGPGQSRQNVQDPEDQQESSFLSEIVENAEDSRRNATPWSNSNDGAHDVRRYGERDYQSHRRERRAHAHQPLKPLLARYTRKKSWTNHSESEDSESVHLSPIKQPTAKSPVIDKELEKEEFLLLEGTPLLESTSAMDADNEKSPNSEGKMTVGKSESVDYSDMSELHEKKVQFEIGPPGSTDEPENERERKKRRRIHTKYDDPQTRLRQGSEIADFHTPLLNKSEMGSNDEFDDIGFLSHRFEDAKGYRRHKLSHAYWQNGTAVPPKTAKYNHQPHEIFVELDILSGKGESREWKEAARWIKYEEDVEEGAERWGKPHVAPLSFHSLISLQQLIRSGVCILDLEQPSLPGIAYRVVEQLAIEELINMEDRGMIMRSLLLKHRHVTQNDRGWKFHLRRNSGSLTSLDAGEDKSRHKSVADMLPRRNSTSARLVGIASTDQCNFLNNENKAFTATKNGGDVRISLESNNLPDNFSDGSKGSMTNLSEEDIRWANNKESILRRIPPGAEASLVLVGKDDHLKQAVMAFVRLAEGVFMPNVTEVPVPVRFLFIILGPGSLELDYKEVGRSISTLMSNTSFHETAYRASDKNDLLDGIHDFLSESIVLPPGEFDAEVLPFEELKERSRALKKLKERRKSLLSKTETLQEQMTPLQQADQFDPFKRTGKCFGGLRNEICKRYPKYISDFTDGCNPQVVASIIYIYFAAVSGAIAFGGLLAEKTGNHIGISETLIGTSGAGIVFSLLAGQPLLILGVTAPLLLFDESLYKFCTDNDVDFLAFRVWIGVWLSVIGTLVVLFEGSIIARFFTRFTQEIFSALISFLFIVNAVSKIVKIYSEHPLLKSYGNYIEMNKTDDVKYHPNTALLSTILCLGTFLIAFVCRRIRTSVFFTNGIRKMIGNFAVPLGIIAMVATDFSLERDAYTEKLNVPEGLETTKNRTSWIIDARTIDVPYIFAAIVPAFLVFILIFMETSICGLLVGKTDNKLVKGSGSHVDILLLSLLNAGIAVIGGGWLCAATVRSVSHCTSLVKYSVNDAPGEKPKVLGVYEQRVSNLVISIFLGLSVLISPLLVLIPLPVLYGVFLDMGISSMIGVQFFERILLLFKQVSKYPQVPYVRRVRNSKLHLFTFIQIACLSVLWTVKEMPSPIPLAVPFILILLVPLRIFILPRIFKSTELLALDAKGQEPDVKELTPETEEPVVYRDGDQRNSSEGHFMSNFSSVSHKLDPLHDLKIRT